MEKDKFILVYCRCRPADTLISRLTFFTRRFIYNPSFFSVFADCSLVYGGTSDGVSGLAKEQCAGFDSLVQSQARNVSHSSYRYEMV